MAGGQVEAVHTLPPALGAHRVVGAPVCVLDRSQEQPGEVPCLAQTDKTPECALGIPAAGVDQQTALGVRAVVRGVYTFGQGRRGVPALELQSPH